MKKVLIPRFDNIGDLVLLEGLLRAAGQTYPDADFTLLVRPDLMALAPLFPSGIRWQPIGINPHRSLPTRDGVKLLQSALTGADWDEIWFTAFSSTWVDITISRVLHKARQFAVTAFPHPTPRLDRIFAELKFKSAPADLTACKSRETEHELAKYQKFWKRVGKSSNLPFPELNIPGEAAREADSWLTENGFHQTDFAVCFPFVAGAPYRSWPWENYVEALCWMAEKHRITWLLMGHSSEQRVLEEVRDACQRRGVTPRIWIGEGRELAICAALIRRSLFYFGNDSGPMHMACGLGIPVAALFGGGTWPRFLPFGRGSVAYHPMPCFGCRWDCCFGDAPCVQRLAVEDVHNMLDEFLERLRKPDANALIQCAVSTLPEETAELVEKASQLYRKLRISFHQADEDREIRLRDIRQLEKQLHEAETDRAERLRMVHHLEGLLKESEEDRRRRLDVINDLQRRLEESDADRAARLEVIKSLSQRLEESEADRTARLNTIDLLGKQLAEAQADRNARLSVINQLRCQLEEAEAERRAALETSSRLRGELEQSDTDRNTRLDDAKELTRRLAESEQTVHELRIQLEEKGKYDLRRLPGVRRLLKKT